jgi:hypothetical protein
MMGRVRGRVRESERIIWSGLKNFLSVSYTHVVTSELL